VLAEHGALDPDSLNKMFGIRGDLLRRIVTAPLEGDLKKTCLHLARVLQRDIRMGLSRLKQAPGVHEAEIEKLKATDLE
jgi:putative Mg2+ transporter-C (MgtC) family protein